MTFGYGTLWASTDTGNRWHQKSLPDSAQISFGAINTADLTPLTHGDVVLAGGGRDAHVYNGHMDEWKHIYGTAGIGLNSGYIGLPHKVALDRIRGDVYITDSRGLFRIDARFRPSEAGTTEFEDRDDDNVPDSVDVFPDDPSEYQDTDRDGIGNDQDDDDDGDGIEDSLDLAPLDSSESLDQDGDGVGDKHDNDKDGDGVVDLLDQFPLDSTESKDLDRDGIGDWKDLDDDNDGVEDRMDAFPLYSGETHDSDGDSIGDNIDPNPMHSTYASESHLSAAVGSWLSRTATSISMNLSKPVGLQAPEITGGKSLYGTLTLGNAAHPERHLMLVTFDSTEPPVLFLDRNGDSELTNDGPALHLSRWENRPKELWYRSWVEVSYLSGVTLPYYLYVSVSLNENGESAELMLGASGRVVSITTPENIEINLVAVDGNGDGVFNGSLDFFCVDLNFDRALTDCAPSVDETSNSERFSHGESFTIDQRTYTPRISPSGYTIDNEIEESANSISRFNVDTSALNKQPDGKSSLIEPSEITEDVFIDPIREH